MNKMLMAKLDSWRNGMALITVNEDEAREILRAYLPRFSESILFKEDISKEEQLICLLAIGTLMGEYRVWV